MEERPVPKGDAPGEWYSPTQPFPVKPPPLARNSFDKDKDMVTAADTTPEHAQACQELWDKAGGLLSTQGPFTPFPFHEAGAPAKSALQFPGVGGPNWGGTAADPTTATSTWRRMMPHSSGWIEKKVARRQLREAARIAAALRSRAAYLGRARIQRFHRRRVCPVPETAMGAACTRSTPIPAISPGR